MGLGTFRHHSFGHSRSRTSEANRLWTLQTTRHQNKDSRSKSDLTEPDTHTLKTDKHLKARRFPLPGHLHRPIKISPALIVGVVERGAAPESFGPHANHPFGWRGCLRDIYTPMMGVNFMPGTFSCAMKTSQSDAINRLFEGDVPVFGIPLFFSGVSYVRWRWDVFV